MTRADSGLVLGLDGQRVFVPDSTVERVEVSLGYRSEVGPWARNGAILGALVGLTTGIALSDDDFLGTDALDVVLLTVAMAAAGAGSGALWGLMLSREEWLPVRYKPVSLSLSAMDGTPGLGVKVTLRR